jgi:histidyl-tRNA synthetase
MIAIHGRFRQFYQFGFEVIGSDDAMKAKWVPISEVARMKHLMFEDHYDMLSELVGV